MTKIKFDAADLRGALDGNLAKKGTMPVLEHVRLDVVAADSQATITSSDLQQTLSRRFECSAQADVSVCLFADKLNGALIGQEGEGTLTIDNAKPAALKFGRRRYAIPMLPGDQFSEKSVFDQDYPDAIDVDVSALFGKVARCAHFAPKHDYRPHLVSVCLRPNHLLACNSTRIVHVDFETGFERDFILPLPGALLCHAVVQGDPEEAKLMRGTNRLAVVAGQAAISSIGLEGSYPDMREIIRRMRVRADADEGVEVEVALAKPAMRRLGYFADTAYPALQDGSLVLHGEDNDRAEVATEQLGAVCNGTTACEDNLGFKVENLSLVMDLGAARFLHWPCGEHADIPTPHVFIPTDADNEIYGCMPSVK